MERTVIKARPKKRELSEEQLNNAYKAYMKLANDIIGRRNIEVMKNVSKQ